MYVYIYIYMFGNFPRGPGDVRHIGLQTVALGRAGAADWVTGSSGKALPARLPARLLARLRRIPKITIGSLDNP